MQSIIRQWSLRALVLPTLAAGLLLAQPAGAQMAREGDDSLSARAIGSDKFRAAADSAPLSESRSFAAPAVDGVNQLRRNVMGVNVDGHGSNPLLREPGSWVFSASLRAALRSGHEVYFLSRMRSISDFSWPPSISIMVPLTMCISGEASITTRLATSSTSAMRPIGIEAGASLSASS